MKEHFFFSQSIHAAGPSKFAEDAVIFGFDTEFRSDNQRLVCWQLAYNGKAELFLPPLSWERLLQESERMCGQRLKKYKTFYYACYFSLAELQHLPRHRVKLDQWFAGAYDATYKVDPYRRMRIVDINQWFPNHQLKQALATFGLKKLDYPGINHVTEESLKDRNFIKYALNDADSTGKLFHRTRKKMWTSSGVDILKYRTPAAASLRYFRQAYVKETINNPKQRLRSLALYGKHGGAVMNYYRGELDGHFYYYDAFSQYPQAVLALGVLPRARDWKVVCDISDIPKNAKGGLFRVLFRYPDGFRYPCLPVKTNAGTFYPLAGQSYCTLAELQLAITQGCDVDLYAGWVFCSGTNALTRYMNELLALRKRARKNKNTGQEYLYKMLMNSLLGKFGQQYRRIPITQLERLAEAKQMTLEQVTNYVGYVEQHTLDAKVCLGAGYIPEWYALITGKARASVLEAAWKNEALAIVIDSVICQRELTQHEYGGISYGLQAQGCKYVAYREMFYGLYDRNGNEVRAAHQGMPKGPSIPILQKFDSDLEEIHYERQRILKMNEAIRRGERAGAHVTEKHCKPLVTTRGIIPEGGTGWVMPFAVAPK